MAAALKELAQRITHGKLTHKKSSGDITFQKLLNNYAELYASETDADEKLELLVSYLEWLMIIASPDPWSKMKSNIDAPIDHLKPPLGDLIFCNLRPAIELQEALLQLANGEKPLLFRRQRKAGKPPLEREKLFWWAVGAALITVLIQHDGKSQREASDIVARVFKKYSRPLPGKPTTATPAWQLLQTWRDKCIAGEKGMLAGYWYDLYATQGPKGVRHGYQNFVESIVKESSHRGSGLPDRLRRLGRLGRHFDKLVQAKPQQHQRRS
jgi:hypothetical protein